MFVRTQNGKRFINLANVTDVYSERKTESTSVFFFIIFNKLKALA